MIMTHIPAKEYLMVSRLEFCCASSLAAEHDVTSVLLRLANGLRGFCSPFREHTGLA